MLARPIQANFESLPCKTGVPVGVREIYTQARAVARGGVSWSLSRDEHRNFKRRFSQLLALEVIHEPIQTAIVKAFFMWVRGRELRSVGHNQRGKAKITGVTPQHVRT